MTALAHSGNLPGMFREDSGVFGPTGKGDDRSPEVERILALGKKAIPLLISHLDDMRFTAMSTCCTVDGLMERVTVADASFDILTAIIRRARPIYDLKCLKGEDREFAESDNDCLEKGLLGGKNLKRNWLNAYRAGKIHYKKFDY